VRNEECEGLLEALEAVISDDPELQLLIYGLLKRQGNL